MFDSSIIIHYERTDSGSCSPQQGRQHYPKNLYIYNPTSQYRYESAINWTLVFPLPYYWHFFSEVLPEASTRYKQILLLCLINNVESWSRKPAESTAWSPRSCWVSVMMSLSTTTIYWLVTITYYSVFKIIQCCRSPYNFVETSGLKTFSLYL